MLIRIVPVGIIPQSILELVCSELEEILNSKCRVMPKIDVPRDAYNHWRKQYDAAKIMEMLSTAAEVKFIDKTIPTLMITNEDIYYSGLNFVFGLEDPSKSCCIVSIARLRPEFYDKRPNSELLTERLIKECVHEVGHHLGMEHCYNNWCVMCFSPSIVDVDTKQKDFCRECKVKMMTRGISLE